MICVHLDTIKKCTILSERVACPFIRVEQMLLKIKSPSLSPPSNFVFRETFCDDSGPNCISYARGGLSIRHCYLSPNFARFPPLSYPVVCTVVATSLPQTNNKRSLAFPRNYNCIFSPRLFFFSCPCYLRNRTKNRESESCFLGAACMFLCNVLYSTESIFFSFLHILQIW